MRIVLNIALTSFLAFQVGNHHALPKTVEWAPPAPRVSIQASSNLVVPLIRLDETGEKHSFCTGSIIGDNLILTAAHCMDEPEFYVLVEDKLERVTKVLFKGGPYGSVNDVALVEANTHGLKPIPLSKGDKEYPQMCVFLGFSGTMDRSLMPCVMLYRHAKDGATGYGQARGGDSGGPVVGEDGAIIGIVWGKTVGEFIRPEYFYVVPIESIRNALKAIDRLPL